MRPSRLSSAFIGSYIATLFVLQWWQRTSYPQAVWLTIAALLWLGTAGVFTLRTNRGQAISVLAFLMACGAGLAFFTVMLATHVMTDRSIERYAGKTITFQGTIAEEPDKRPLVTKYTVEARALALSGETIRVDGRVLVTDRRGWPEYELGDEIRASGKLQLPGTIDDFHYDIYLERFAIFSIMPYARLELVRRGPFSLQRTLTRIKEAFEGRIDRLLPEPHASLLAGLLTGSRRGIPEHLLDDFNAAGLTHIIAISGYNVTIILSLLGGLLFWLPLKWRLVPSIIAIALFTLFVGASASVVRAAIMGTLGIIALHAGRLPHRRLAILWTLFFMTVWNPQVLWNDAGFQLSFLAVIGLLECGPFLAPFLAWAPETFAIRDSLQTTLAAQIAAVPWIMFLFGRLSLIAPLSNILVAPLIPLAMLTGFLSVLLSTVFFNAGLLLAYVAWGFLELIIIVAHFSASIPYASLTTPHLNAILVALYYVSLALLLAFLTIRTRAPSSLPS